MKTITLASLSLCLMIAGCNQDGQNDTKAELSLESIEQKVSYVVGYDTARRMQAEGFTLDADVIAQAVEDLNAGTEAAMTDEEMQAAMMAFQTEIQEKRQAQYSEVADKNQELGEKFLTENKQRDGVVTTESGLQYEVLEAGEGKSPQPSDEVTVNYKGSLLSGEVFDSGEGVSFVVNQLIPGWVEALPLMKEGAKWKLFVPSELAYGPGGTGNIGPNETLIFEMELVSIGGSAEE